ncbi:MAG: enoyl-CoA hydratase-related protein [Syntrophomonas sp.]
MEFKNIILSSDNAVRIITLNRPQTMNALTAGLIEEMDCALDMIADDRESRVLIITGGEKVFAAGGDIKAMMDCNPLGAKEYVEPIHRVFNKIADFNRPTIAAVCGHALGGGVELAAACDFRIAADNAAFGFPEINLGIFPAAGGSQRMPRLIGISKTKELMFTGDIINASRALAIGLVDQVAPRDELMQAVLELAAKLAAKAPLALSYVKKAIHAGMDMDITAGLAQELEKLMLLFSTSDQKEGMKAFAERRKPVFTGK